MIYLATSAAHPELSDDDQPLLAAFAAAGLAARPIVWTASDGVIDAGDVVVIRSCWDYHLAPQRFRCWLRAVAARGATVANGIDPLLWNIHKRYLLQLAGSGATAIAPTVLVARGEPVPLSEVCATLATGDVVIKPAISLSAYGTWRTFGRIDAATSDRFRTDVAAHDLLVQAYIPEIKRGELSLIFIDGSYSHSVLKTPAAGDFRVQADFGGGRHAVEPSAGMVAWAESVLAAVAAPITYARVDGVQVGSDFLLMELELIDPVLFFGLGGGGAVARFVDAIAGLASTPRRSAGLAG